MSEDVKKIMHSALPSAERSRLEEQLVPKQFLGSVNFEKDAVSVVESLLPPTFYPIHSFIVSFFNVSFRIPYLVI